MTQEALKLARQLLWRYRHEIPIGHQPYMICHQVDEAFESIDEALAQPEQEPVAWPHKYGCRANAFGKCDMGCTTTPQRTWVGLTDEEFQWIYDNGRTPAGMMEIVEAKLKERNT